MIPRTTQELIQAIAPQVDALLGNNPLLDPVANQSNNLVKLLTIAMGGQAELEQRIEAIKFLSQARYLDGEQLDLLAAGKCLTRSECTTSKALLVVSGEDCAVLQAQSQLTDSLGRAWSVTEDITLSGNGSACAFGVGVVEATVCGCWNLKEGELAFDNSNTPNIYSATNSVMLEKGGDLESDDSLRNRLMNTGPLHLIQGTSDSLKSALLQLSGVNFARTLQGEFCGQTGSMVVVHGGLDADICQAILNNGVLACSLIGNVECNSSCFSGVRFQRPCPVFIDIFVSLNCDCPTITEEQAQSIILAQAGSVARTNKIVSSTFLKLHSDIESVRLKVRRPTLGCGEITFTDPITDEVINWNTEDPSGLCGSVSECDNESQIYSQTIRLPEFEMPILGNVTFSTCDPVNVVECASCG